MFAKGYTTFNQIVRCRSWEGVGLPSLQKDKWTLPGPEYRDGVRNVHFNNNNLFLGSVPPT